MTSSLTFSGHVVNRFSAFTVVSRAASVLMLLINEMRTSRRCSDSSWDIARHRQIPG